MISRNNIDQLMAATVYGADGAKIGSVGQVYLDDQTGTPEWVSVSTGLFGTRQSFVPLSQANATGDRIDVPFTKDQVKDAPQIDADAALSPAEEDTLYSHYGLVSTEGRLTDTSGRNDTTGNADYVETDRDSFGRTDAESDDDAMTRSEERLTAGTRTEQVGKARLRKHVVTEQQQVTVPVSREELRVEREPITDANRDQAMAGPTITESEHEVTLHAERPVVSTEAVAVERVRLNKETVTDQETVSGEVRKEAIELDDETTTSSPR